MGLSADGNTALIGNPGDNSVSAFKRSGSTWTKQSSALRPNNATASAGFGGAVGLAADGTTAVIGSPGDVTTTGSFWTFKLSAGAWKQQGAEVVPGAPHVVSGDFGTAVAISADASEAVISGSQAGGAWVYRRSGTAWAQQGSALAAPSGPDVTFGAAVALSSAGTLALIGEPSNSRGGVWTFVPGTAAVGPAKPVTPAKPAPTLSGFKPASGKPGSRVTITGKNLATAYEVQFAGNAFAPDPIRVTATKVIAIVPATARSGRITVRTHMGSVRSVAMFTVLRKR